MASPWFRRLGVRTSPSVRLFCFHHAGGSASVYRSWPTHLAENIQALAVQLPGRENRILEQPYERMAPLVEAYVEAAAGLDPLPFAFFGSSMGARIAAEATRVLAAHRLPTPVGLFVASSTAPALRLPIRGWNEPVECLVAYLREMGGTPAEVMGSPQFMADLLPVIRADLTVVGTHAYRERPPLDLPIHAFAGRDDRDASADRMDAWRAETDGSFALDVVDGGHFFTPSGQRRVIETVSRELMSLVEPRAFADKR